MSTYKHKKPLKPPHVINSRSLSNANYILLTIENSNKIAVIPISQVKLYHKFLHLRIQLIYHSIFMPLSTTYVITTWTYLITT